jgi:hypothetical protein
MLRARRPERAPDCGGRRVRGAANATSTNAQRVGLCNQPRVLDLGSRGARFAENAPPAVIHEVLAKLSTDSSAGRTITAALRGSNPRAHTGIKLCQRSYGIWKP